MTLKAQAFPIGQSGSTAKWTGRWPSGSPPSGSGQRLGRGAFASLDAKTFSSRETGEDVAFGQNLAAQMRVHGDAAAVARSTEAEASGDKVK
jgi:hypothetical protein